MSFSPRPFLPFPPFFSTFFCVRSERSTNCRYISTGAAISFLTAQICSIPLWPAWRHRALPMLHHLLNVSRPIDALVLEVSRILALLPPLFFLSAQYFLIASGSCSSTSAIVYISVVFSAILASPSSSFVLIYLQPHAWIHFTRSPTFSSCAPLPVRSDILSCFIFSSTTYRSRV